MSLAEDNSSCFQHSADQHHVILTYVTLLSSQKELLAPNIMEMVHAFNSLAQLVPTEVLVEEHLHQRAEVISAYIKVCTCTVYTGSDLVGCVKSESVDILYSCTIMP